MPRPGGEDPCRVLENNVRLLRGLLGLVIPRLRLSRPALALALVGVFVGLTGFWIAARIDRARALSGLEADLKERAFSLDVQFTRAAAAVKETGAMLRVTPRLPRESFAALAADLHHDVACLMALEWVPRVSALEREAHEREARREGVEGYEIREGLGPDQGGGSGAGGEDR